MKYIEVNKLIGEIDRRLREDYSDDNSFVDEAVQGALISLIYYITSSQQEIDLDTEISV